MVAALAQAFQGVLAQNQPIPAGADAGRIALTMLKGGTTYEELRAIMGAGAQSWNVEMMTAYGDMFYPTEKNFVYYPNGGTLPTMPTTSDSARANLIRGDVSAHMIDRQVYTLGIGGGWRALMDMAPEYILASVQALIQIHRNTWDKAMLTRALTTTETLLGQNGYDVPFCNGSPNSGSGGIIYAPPQWNGQTFTYSHTHYVGYDSSQSNPLTSANYTYGDAIDGTAKLINEHGLQGTYKLYVSEQDVATVLALAKYVQPVELDGGQWDRGGETSGNRFIEPGEFEATPASGGRYIGSYNSGYGKVKIWATYRIPQGYGFMYRPGPQGAKTNALAVNYRPEFGLGCKILEKPSWETTFPLAEVDVELEFGVSCGACRYQGAAFHFASGIGTAYADPTIN